MDSTPISLRSWIYVLLKRCFHVILADFNSCWPFKAIIRIPCWFLLGWITCPHGHRIIGLALMVQCHNRTVFYPWYEHHGTPCGKTPEHFCAVFGVSFLKHPKALFFFPWGSWSTTLFFSEPKTLWLPLFRKQISQPGAWASVGWCPFNDQQ